MSYLSHHLTDFCKRSNITRTLKHLGVGLTALEDYLGVFSDSRCTAAFNLLSNSFVRYRRVTTNISPQHTYTQEELSKEMQTFRELEKNLMVVMREINAP